MNSAVQLNMDALSMVWFFGIYQFAHKPRHITACYSVENKTCESISNMHTVIENKWTAAKYELKLVK